MHIEPYLLSSSSSQLRYTFISRGTKGRKQKIIEFFELDRNFLSPDIPVFNLGFGDTQDGVEIDDTVISDNGDMETVLRTVAKAAELFLENNPSALIFFEGSTKSRTRLYRKMLNKYYTEISEKFTIWGIHNNKITPFISSNTSNFEAFLVKQK
ncbi:DUF6934 family protein [Gallibacterium genomosp. 1]|uniref:DUF6934 family protein n=1 Tax=Gallibacterium genomosp. 1 TaxID=155515 RepID=UPI00068FC766|nr:hypothetical protein [Gallibacterium genomosp. 1]